MSSSEKPSHGLTAEDFEKIREFTSSGGTASDLGTTAPRGEVKVDVEQCATIRSRTEDTLAALADEFGVDQSTIYRHRNGDCTHALPEGGR